MYTFIFTAIRKESSVVVTISLPHPDFADAMFQSVRMDDPKATVLIDAIDGVSTMTVETSKSWQWIVRELMASDIEPAQGVSEFHFDYAPGIIEARVTFDMEKRALIEHISSHPVLPQEVA